MLSTERITAVQHNTATGIFIVSPLSDLKGLHMADSSTVVVIGAGTAGNAAARTLTGAGWRVIQIERDRWGGTCLWRGCIPKKSLYTSAATMRALNNAEQFGIVPGQVGFDWQSALAWKWHAQETYAGDQEGIAKERGIEIVHGDATFKSPTEVEVAGTVYSADHIVIATGSEPVRLQIPGVELADSSEDALRYESVPDSLVIIGGGFIAMEMAGIYASFGTKVAVITHSPRVLNMIDAELADSARRQLSALGVAFATDCSVEAISGSRGAIEVHVLGSDGTSRVLSAARVLMATGRRPAIADLNVDAAGLEVDGHGGLVIDEYLRTNRPHIWAAGDAAGGMMHTPVANTEGHTVGRSISTSTLIRMDYSAVPVACFTLPQCATVGLSEEQAEANGRKVKVSRVALGGVGAAIIAGMTDGFTKIVVDEETDKVVGVQSAGPAASDIIYAAAVAMKAGMTAEQIGEVAAVHPSHAEALYFAGG